MTQPPQLSVVVPVYNEAENLQQLTEQIGAALDGLDFELILVDDGSNDDSADRLADLQGSYPWLRALTHARNAGQSTALCSGVQVAQGELIATLDGDLQNDPADIPLLMRTWDESGQSRGQLIVGHRVNRQDSALRKLSSRVANGVRGWLLKDNCPDTGCSLKLFRRDEFLLLPQFDHMHRFLPALFARQGSRTINVPVRHHPRAAGVSKYGVGNRLWVGIMDLFGMLWLRSRRFPVDAIERLDTKVN